jgi:hypothetical protein
MKSRLFAQALARVFPVLSAIFFFTAFDCTQAATINASSVALTAVQTAVNSANPGDTVNVPAGTATWTGTLTINNNIQLIGAGASQTIIVDGGSTALNLINWNTTSGGYGRLSGFTFKGNGNATAYNGTIDINGTCHEFRVDDCVFSILANAGVVFNGWVYGVVDHCNFWRANTFGVQVHHDGWGGYSWGDGSWAAPDNLGSTNAIYIENCAFTNNYSSPGAFDMENGGRIVFRYNTLTNDNIGFHGTESGQRERSGRTFEIYSNYFMFSTNLNSSWFCGFFIRGGSGVIFNNYFYNYNSLAQVADYRLTPNGGPWIPWGNANGENGWDSDGSGVYASGTASSSSVNSLTDNTKNWAINQWVSSSGAFVLQDVNQNNADWIYSNNATTVFFSSGDHLGGGFNINGGDSYTIGLVNSSLDQPGRGQGDLLANNASGSPYDTITSATNWPNEAADPIYEWNNTLVMPLQNPYHPYIVANEPTMLSGRDYYDGVTKPGYTPLVYPHPLDTTNAVTSPPPTYTLTVTSGSGGGSYNSGSIVSITASTIANETFAYWSGPDIISTNAASTTVTMPAANITVTANYAPYPPSNLQAVPTP